MKVAFTLGPEGGAAPDTRWVQVQLRQDRFLERNVASIRAVDAYLSSDAAGVSLATTGTLAHAAGGDGGELMSPLDVATRVVTNADGKVDLAVTSEADAAETYYVNVVTPDGKVHTSPAVTFVDDTP